MAQDPIEAFIDGQAPAVRPIIRRLRALVRATLPDLVEYLDVHGVIRYGRGTTTREWLCYISGHRAHANLGFAALHPQHVQRVHLDVGSFQVDRLLFTSHFIRWPARDLRGSRAARTPFLVAPRDGRAGCRGVRHLQCGGVLTRVSPTPRPPPHCDG